MSDVVRAMLPCSHGRYTHHLYLLDPDDRLSLRELCTDCREVRLRRKDRIDARLTGYDPDTNEYIIMSHVNLWEEVPDDLE